MYKLLEVLGGVFVKVYEDGKIETLPSKWRKVGRIRKPSTDRYGYLHLTFSHNGQRKTYTIHRLVALAFISNPEDKPTVNHINGIKTDNRVCNLEWATHSEQKQHSINSGLCSNNLDALQKHNEKQSKSIHFRGKLYQSIRQAARENKVHARVVLREGVVQNEQLGY